MFGCHLEALWFDSILELEWSRFSNIRHKIKYILQRNCLKDSTGGKKDRLFSKEFKYCDTQRFITSRQPAGSRTWNRLVRRVRTYRSESWLLLCPAWRGNMAPAGSQKTLPPDQSLVLELLYICIYKVQHFITQHNLNLSQQNKEVFLYTEVSFSWWPEKNCFLPFILNTLCWNYLVLV